MFDLLESVVDKAWEPDAEVLFRLTVAAYGEDCPDEHHFLPSDLEEVLPGRYLAVVLSSVDRSKLSGYDVVRLLKARSRLVSHDQAGFYADMAEVAHAYDPDTTARDSFPTEFAPEEIQTALHKTRRAAETDLELALHLHYRMPGIWEALHRGDIDLARTRVFTRELESLHPGLVPEAVERTLGDAADLTTGQLRARLQKISPGTRPGGCRGPVQGGGRGPEDDHTCQPRPHRQSPLS